MQKKRSKAVVKQYIPTFFEGYKPETIEVENLEELLKVEWVMRFKVQDFIQFVKKIEDDGAIVFAEYPDEKHIVCFVNDKNIVKELPDYEESKK